MAEIFHIHSFDLTKASVHDIHYLKDVKVDNYNRIRAEVRQIVADELQRIQSRTPDYDMVGNDTIRRTSAGLCLVTHSIRLTVLSQNSSSPYRNAWNGKNDSMVCSCRSGIERTLIHRTGTR